MDNFLNKVLWNQFGASIDMLENAILMCPNELWDNGNKFWYNAYHCLFFLDYYLTMDADSFSPPQPYTFSEFDPAGAMPDRTYTKAELLDYLQLCRNKCHNLLANMTAVTAESIWINKSRTMHYTVMELILYNMRHVQHHAAQLNLLLRQGMDNAPNWISRSKIDL